MLTATRDEGVDADCDPRTATGQRTLRKTVEAEGGQKRQPLQCDIDTGTERHTVDVGIVVIGVA